MRHRGHAHAEPWAWHPKYQYGLEALLATDLNPSDFRELVSGRRRGVSASLLRGALRVAEVPYTCAIRWRNRQFDRGRKAIERVGVPVVSVGNLTLGGTGKTPLVEWLARWFRAQDLRVTIVSRGYGAEAGARNDEALELEQKLPDVPHVQNPDRVAAARMAIEEFQSQVILLDDAFQHRRIHRDLDIVLFDALEPFGYGHVFPRGVLREPLSGLSRAHVVALSRANLVDPAERERIKSVVRRNAPDALWIECDHAPRGLRSAAGTTAELTALAGVPVAAFCGIGNPDGFRRTLQQCGVQVAAVREFPDHFGYQRTDVESLSEWAAGLAIEAVVCTQKDLVKLGIDRLGRRPLWALAIGLQISAGQTAFEARLQQVLAAVKR
ncbi:MAG TPA: tetraacyldisaccharide 4'-kinase [Pirellulales bacterium]|jgi:tetraacyldisaccharide 4'-kinase|nr:tetraacyldisaccharide 4'-kinase [Pirellulales bacterium]